MTPRFRISLTLLRPSTIASTFIYRPLALAAVTATLLACSSQRDIALEDFTRWHETAHAQARAGMLAWSELYKQSFDRLAALPPSIQQDTRLENTVLLLSTARKYEAQEIDAQQFAAERKNIEAQLEARLR